MNSIKKYLMLLCCSTSLMLYSQATDIKIIPPSPNAQTFQKYGDYPVSLYTGVPEVNIPLYTISLKDINIPINLSYNTSGIKVDEDAGRAGLGWVLNAGGIITHTVMGENDSYSLDVTKGQYFTSFIPDLINIGMPVNPCIKANMFSTTPNGINTYSMFRSLASSYNYDLQPDIYHYDFMGYSGDFIIKHNYEIVQRNDNNLKIIIDWTPNSKLDHGDWTWIIILPNGNKYYFTDFEMQRTSSVPGGSNISAWYLSKIQTTEGNIINFKYQKYTVAVCSFGKLTQNALLDNSTISSSYRNYDVLALTEIDHSLGKVVFNYTNQRKDLKNELQLNSIQTYTSNTQEKSIQFKYKDFVSNVSSNEFVTVARLNSIGDPASMIYTNDWNNNRLRLDSVIEQDPFGNKINK